MGKKKQKKSKGKRYKTNKKPDINNKISQEEIKSEDIAEKEIVAEDVKVEETKTTTAKENKKEKKKDKEKNNKKEDKNTQDIDKKEKKTKNKKEKDKPKKEKKEKKKAKKEKVITDEEREKRKAKKEKIKKVIKAIAIILGIIILICVAILAYLIINPKFKDIQIELGTEEIKIEDFLTLPIYKNGAEFVTDISQIDLTQVDEYKIKLQYRGKEQTVKLTIADTTPPEVTTQNITKYIDYEINPEDFIAEKNDKSEMTVELVEAPQIAEFGDYNITIKVKDAQGNETIKSCILTITWIRPEIHLELGTELTLADIIFDVDEYGENVSEEDLANVNTLVIGEYIVNAERDGMQYQTKIIVQDTTPPTLELQDVTIYDNETISDYTRFIRNVSDASGEPTTALKTTIDYSIVGTQSVVIEAVDINGNRVEQTAILTITKDNDGPVISGLTSLSVAKYGTVNYYSGVSAYDRKDGYCEVTVDSSRVNTSVAGTYYATYTASDTKGNTTTETRRIIVEHNAEDTTQKFDEFYNNYLAGKDPVGMASAIREQITYSSNWGGSDPVWYGLTEGRGNCYVHARIMQRALQKAGYSNQIIYLTDESHYWNLVNINRVWRHIDATPSVNHTLGLLTDAQKLADAGLHGKTWDVTKWPAAE